MEMKKHEPTIEQIKVDDLIPYATNSRTHSAEQVAQIAASMVEFGWTNPVLIDTRGTIVAGHGRVMAARKLGMETVPCIRLGHLSPAQVRAYVIADNKLALNAGWDEELLAAELRALAENGFEIGLTGFEPSELKKLLDDNEEDSGSSNDAAEAIDRAEQAQAKWGVKLGDFWRMGSHIIACGDSTDPNVWSRMLGGEKAQLTHTDPPYGVSYKDSAGVGIQNDSLQGNDLAALVREALMRCIEMSRDDAAFYIWHATSTRRDFEHALDTVGLQERQYITWVKESFTLGRSDYHWQTEPCFYAEKSGHRAKWFGDRCQSTVWTIGATDPKQGTYTVANGIHISDGDKAELFIKSSKPKSAGKIRHIRIKQGESIDLTSDGRTTAWQIGRDPKNEYYHPTQKPVAIPEMAIVNSTAPGDIVLEPFSGSGSTLLACQNLGRRCRACDIEPKFVAVAIERWSIATGKTPTKC
jgi:DNA modification methylase